MLELNVRLFRGTNIESQHRVIATVVDSSNNTLMSWGDHKQKIYPRSSIKPLQAISLILSGAYTKFNISQKELAIATASHSGEPEHIELVSNWLKRLNLSAEDLECGAHAPSNLNASNNLVVNHLNFTALHNNCSGKHTGMLATAMALNVNKKGYVQDEHSVQQLIKKNIEDFCSEKIEKQNIGIDGCSIPTYFMPLNKLALSMARFAAPENMGADYEAACKKIFNAIIENPFYVAGTDRYCTQMIKALDGQGFVKTGAEGVMFAAIPNKKIGIALKVEDGATRASEIAMSWILKELGLLSEKTSENFLNSEIKNWSHVKTSYLDVHSSAGVI